jgi:predicted metal-binding protein
MECEAAGEWRGRDGRIGRCRAYRLLESVGRATNEDAVETALWLEDHECLDGCDEGKAVFADENGE